MASHTLNITSNHEFRLDIHGLSSFASTEWDGMCSLTGLAYNSEKTSKQMFGHYWAVDDYMVLKPMLWIVLKNKEEGVLLYVLDSTRTGGVFKGLQIAKPPFKKLVNFKPPSENQVKVPWDQVASISSEVPNKYVLHLSELVKHVPMYVPGAGLQGLAKYRHIF